MFFVNKQIANEKKIWQDLIPCTINNDSKYMNLRG